METESIRPVAFRPWIWILCWVSAWLVVAPGITSADPRLLDDAGKLWIESIQVDGLRHLSPELVISETLLLEGGKYTESELQQAVFRLQRLPFVLDARFSLAKGTERGRYRLVVTVEEIRRFFFGEDTTYTRFSNSVAFDSVIGQDTSFTPGGLAGIRFFVGKYGMLFGSVSTHGGLQAGYTQYNLFDRRAFLSIGLTTQSCCPIQIFSLGVDPTFASWQNEGDLRQGQITLGLPLKRRFQLRFQAGQTYSEEGQRRNLLDAVADQFQRATLDYRDQRRLQLEAALIYDSTDDPVFPSQGMTWTAALDFERQKSRLSVFVPLFPGLGGTIDLPPGGDPNLPEFESEQLRAAFTLAQHWRITRRQTVSLSARLAAGMAQVTNLPIIERKTEELDPCASPFDEDCPADHTLRVIAEEDLSLIEGYFTARHSFSLWSAAKARNRGDLRLEQTLEFGYDQVSPSLDLAENPLYRKSFTTSIVFRNAWGLFRFSLQIADYGRDA